MGAFCQCLAGLEVETCSEFVGYYLFVFLGFCDFGFKNEFFVRNSSFLAYFLS
jgi:hypothetical protein